LLPLERAVTLAPEEKAGWRALAQAWLLLGDHEAAQQALHSTPALPTGLIRGSDLHWGVGLEAERGHDSNANQGTSATSITVPALGNILFRLNPLSRQNADDYWADSVHVNGQWILSPAMDLHLSAGDTHRNYDDLHIFSTEDRSVSAGGNYSGYAGAWSAGMQYEQLLQAGQLARRSVTASLNWQAVRNSPVWPVIGIDIGSYRFAGGMQAPDGFNEHVLSVSNAIVLGSCSIGWAVLTGRDLATVRRADGDRDMLGMRLMASGPLFRNIDWFGWLGHVDSHYHHPNPAFLDTRHETLEDLTVGLNWPVYRGWSIQGQVSLSRQRSNIRLFDYRRTDSNLGIRYDFGS